MPPNSWHFFKIRATRWLSLELRFCKVQFRPGLYPGSRWGSVRRSPDPLVEWGGDTPPHSHPIDAFGVEDRWLLHRETDTGGVPLNPIPGSAPGWAITIACARWQCHQRSMLRWMRVYNTTLCSLISVGLAAHHVNTIVIIGRQQQKPQQLVQASTSSTTH